MNERNPGEPESFDERWQQLANQLSEELPQSLVNPPNPNQPRIIHPAEPTELAGVDQGLDDYADGWPEAQGAPDTPPGPRDWAEPAAADHYVPPEPPKVFDAQPVLVLGWVAFLGGLLAVLAWAIFRPALDVWVARFGLMALVLGAGLLVWRMPHRRDPEDTSNGAQV